MLNESIIEQQNSAPQISAEGTIDARIEFRQTPPKLSAQISMLAGRPALLIQGSIAEVDFLTNLIKSVYRSRSNNPKNIRNCHELKLAAHVCLNSIRVKDPEYMDESVNVAAAAFRIGTEGVPC